MISFMQTQDNITVFVNYKPYQISSADANFVAVSEMLEKDGESADPQALLDLLLTPAQELGKELEEEALTDKLAVIGGELFYKRGPLKYLVPNELGSLILNLKDKGLKIQKYLNFVNKVMKNPLASAREDLCRFIVKGALPITEEGNFLAYKAVRKDFKDIHSGTFDNSVGQSPEMLFSEVDPNPNRTCSRGLHVCSYGYLPHFRHADGHVVVVTVNPADVVSVPADYNDTKMRVAKYTVVDVNRTFYEEHPECILSKEVYYSDKPYILRFATNKSMQKEVIRGYDTEVAAETAFEGFKDKHFYVELSLNNEVVMQNTNPDLEVIKELWEVWIKANKGEEWEMVSDDAEDQESAEELFENICSRNEEETHPNYKIKLTLNGKKVLKHTFS